MHRPRLAPPPLARTSPIEPYLATLPGIVQHAELIFAVNNEKNVSIFGLTHIGMVSGAAQLLRTLIAHMPERLAAFAGSRLLQPARIHLTLAITTQCENGVLRIEASPRQFATSGHKFSDALTLPMPMPLYPSSCIRSNAQFAW